jgi:hypothetical protein
VPAGTTAAGVPIAAELMSGWAGAQPVVLRTLYRAFAAEVTRTIVGWAISLTPTLGPY